MSGSGAPTTVGYAEADEYHVDKPFLPEQAAPTKEEKPTVWALLWLVFAVLSTGAFAAIANKVLYDMKTKGRYGESNAFNKPYFLTLCMFIGESLCLTVVVYNRWQERRQRLQALQQGSARYSMLTVGVHEEASSVNSPGGNVQSKTNVFVFLLLCTFDLSATAIGGVGLNRVDASTNQMLRGSMILFTGIFTVLILRRQLRLKQWVGIGIVCMGLIVVGASSLLEPKDDDDSHLSTGEKLLGIFLVVVGAALNSAQGVFEEKLMKGAGDVDPLVVVGWEGLFGTLLSGLVLLPATQYLPGSDLHEDTIDTFDQMSNSGMVVFLVVGYTLSLAAMNYYSQKISKVFSAVLRMLIQNLRTVAVWIVSLILYYARSGYGEKWTNFSFIKLGGFGVLIVGTLVFVKAREEPAPTVASDADGVHDEDSLDAALHATPAFASPEDPKRIKLLATADSAAL